MTDLLRIYEPSECGEDGYPLAWHECPDCDEGTGAYVFGDEVRPCYSCQRAGSIKDLIRQLADHRCVRCGHPYRKGQSEPEWSPCDERCTHAGPVRLRAEAEVPCRCGKAMEPINEDGSGRVLVCPDLRAGKSKHDSYAPHSSALYEAKRRVLTVHHLTGSFGNEQEAKRDCRWWNLAALCQRCHLSIQARVNMPRRWLHEHSEWFKPHVAGYYAWTYLGREVSREEAVERMDELLALEHRQEELIR